MNTLGCISSFPTLQAASSTGMAPEPEGAPGGEPEPEAEDEMVDDKSYVVPGEIELKRKSVDDSDEELDYDQQLKSLGFITGNT